MWEEEEYYGTLSSRPQLPPRETVRDHRDEVKSETASDPGQPPSLDKHGNK